MLQVGLTGGIGSGKSEVSRLLVARGAVLVDADRIARAVVAPGTPGLRAVVEAFGDGVLRPDGSLDRERLAQVVFADGDARARLEAIVHPLVRERSAAVASAAAPGSVVVHDVPLLVESGLGPVYDLVVVVDAAPETQVDRLVRERGMTPAAALARIAAQASRGQRLAVADVVLRNDGSLEDLERQVDELWSALRERAATMRTARPDTS